MREEYKYESVIIFRPQTTLLAEAILEEKIAKIIGRNKITEIEKQGIKKLAYEIKGNQKGYFLIIYFKGNFMIVNELEQYFKNNNSIIKYITIKVEE